MMRDICTRPRASCNPQVARFARLLVARNDAQATPHLLATAMQLAEVLNGLVDPLVRRRH